MKILNRKFNPLMTVLTVALLTLAACGGSAAPTAAPAANNAPVATQPAAGGAAAPTAAKSSGEQVELRMAWWGSQDRHDRTIKVINLFQQKYPNIKMTYEFANFNDYWTKMTTEAAGGGLPDVMQQDYAYIADWSARGLIIPLDDLVKSGALNMSDVSDEFLKGGRVNNKLVAINIGSNSQNWVLDVDAFKKAGVDLPPDNWTWDDFEKTAMALHQKLGNWGYGVALSDNQLWKSLYLSLGQWGYSDDGTQLGYTDDKPFADYLAMIVRLEKAGAIPSRAEEQASYNGTSVEQLPMVSSKSDMEYFWSNQITAFWKAAGDNRNFKLMPLPRPAGGKSANYIKPGQFLSITSQSKHPKEAAMFIDFFTNDIEANKILAAERGVPIAAKVRESLKPQLGKPQQTMFDYVASVSKDAQPIRPPDPPNSTDLINNVYTPEVIDPVMFEKITTQQGAATLRKDGNAILAKNKKS